MSGERFRIVHQKERTLLLAFEIKLDNRFKVNPVKVGRLVVDDRWLRHACRFSTADVILLPQCVADGLGDRRVEQFGSVGGKALEKCVDSDHVARFDDARWCLSRRQNVRSIVGEDGRICRVVAAGGNLGEELLALLVEELETGLANGK